MTDVTAAVQPAMFSLDEVNPQHSGHSSANCSSDAHHSPIGEGDSSSSLVHQDADATAAQMDQIDLARRVVPIQETPDDVCSICLDEFTQDDPAQLTDCRHSYHLQCIMQWAQRSCECPLCFKRLQLQDKGLNDLLPFGEYRPPEQNVSSGLIMGMDSWDVDQLLARLSMSSSSSARRSSRAARHAARAVRQTELANESDGVIESALRRGPERSAALPIHMHSDHSSSSPAEYPSSWPPATHLRTRSRVADGDSGTGDGSAATDLRTRWTSRAKATFSHTTKELRSLWGRTASFAQEPAGSQNRGNASSSSTGPTNGGHLV